MCFFWHMKYRCFSVIPTRRHCIAKVLFPCVNAFFCCYIFFLEIRERQVPVCIPCPIGKQRLVGVSSGTICPGDMYGDAQGLADCPAGTALNLTGLTPASACATCNEPGSPTKTCEIFRVARPLCSLPNSSQPLECDSQYVRDWSHVPFVVRDGCHDGTLHRAGVCKRHNDRRGSFLLQCIRLCHH